MHTSQWFNRQCTASAAVHGVELLVEFGYHPEVRGTRDSTGFQLEPDEPAYIEIIKVETYSGEDITDLLSQRVLDMIEEQIKEGKDE